MPQILDRRADATWWIEFTPLWVALRLGGFLLRAFGSYLGVAFFAGLVAALAWQRYRPIKGARAPMWSLVFDEPLLGAGVLVFVVVAACMVSLHTPVILTRNLLVALPAVYISLAFLIAEGAPNIPIVARFGGLRALAALIGVVMLLGLFDHYRPYQQDYKSAWREAAAHIKAQPGCATAPILVWNDSEWGWLPFYAHYLAGSGVDLVEVTPGSAPSAPEARVLGSACPIKLWVWTGVCDNPETCVRHALDGLGWTVRNPGRIAFRNQLLIAVPELTEGAAGPSRRRPDAKRGLSRS